MAGPEGGRPHFDRTPKQHTPIEHPTLPQKSALNRAVERTRDLYERNGWVFLPFGEAAKGNSSSANIGDAGSPEVELMSKSPVIDPPKRRRRGGTFSCPPISEIRPHEGSGNAQREGQELGEDFIFRSPFPTRIPDMEGHERAGLRPEESELTKEEQEWLHLLDEELALPPLPPDFVSNILTRLGIPPQSSEQEVTDSDTPEEFPASAGGESAHEPPIEEIRRENEEFFNKLRRINPEGRKRAQKRLLDDLFGRPPQAPEREE